MTWGAAVAPGWVQLSSEGRYLAANEVALGILGVTLEELRQAPAGAFAAEPRDEAAAQALRDKWESGGRNVLAGATTVARPDGTRITVKFLIEPSPDGTLIAVIRPLEDQHAEVGPTSIYTVGDVLSAWRAAERHLEEIEPGTHRWAELRSQVRELREEYRRLFDSHRASN